MHRPNSNRPKSKRRPSDRERERRRDQARSAPANDHHLETENFVRAHERTPLLVNRREAARLLGGISISTMLRLEQSGALRPICLTDARTAQRFYSMDELKALAARGMA
jgi:hypothetical protein